MPRFHKTLVVAAAVLAGLSTAGPALALGGNYVFVGGTRTQQTEVRGALGASAFDWSVVPGRITIHLGPGTGLTATPRAIWIDTAILDGGIGAWASIQYLYAREVDMLMLDSQARSMFARLLRSHVWCGSDRAISRPDFGCERFASTFVWAYWPSPDNSLSPQSSKDPSAAMPPDRFRATLSALLSKKRR